MRMTAWLLKRKQEWGGEQRKMRDFCQRLLFSVG